MGLFFRVAMCAATIDAPYSFLQFDVPGAGQTVATGINNAGQICGHYSAQPASAYHAFVRDPNGAITTFDYPGSAMTAALGINNAGQIVGYWSPDLTANVQHMFLRDAAGNMTSFDVPDAPENVAAGINDSGQMVVDSLKQPGPIKTLFRDSDGSYRPIVVPGFTSLDVEALNNIGAVVGGTYTADGTRIAYIANGAAVTTFSFPGSTTATTANGINDANVTTGYYTLGYRGGESSHGFIRDNDGNFEALDVPGSRATLAFGINGLNDVVGYYDDAQGGEHGFVATPNRRQRVRR